MKFSTPFFAGISALFLLSSIGCGSKQEPPHVTKAAPVVEGNVQIQPEPKIQAKVQCLEKDEELQFNPKTDEDCQPGTVNREGANLSLDPEADRVLTFKSNTGKQCYQKKYYDIATARIQKVLKENEESMGEFEVKLGICSIKVKPFGFTKDSWKDWSIDGKSQGYQISEMSILNSCALDSRPGEYLDALYLTTSQSENLKDLDQKEMKSALFAPNFSNFKQAMDAIADKDLEASAAQVRHMVMMSYSTCARYLGSPLED